MPPTAKPLWDMMRNEEAKLRERLETMEVGHDLAVELHAPSGAIIRVGTTSYFTDSNDALLVQGIDVSSDVEACEAIVPIESFLELPQIGSQRFIFVGSPNFQIRSVLPFGTFATRLSAQALIAVVIAVEPSLRHRTSIMERRALGFLKKQHSA